jgi:hypothetical protein
MGGGIIINRAKRLLDTAMDPSYYNSFSDEDQATVSGLNSAGAGNITQEQLSYLANLINETTNT